MRSPEVHGHRGCRGLLPENTLSGFLHALRLGADVLEMDVVISADGEVVVSHEPWFSAAICQQPDGRPIVAGTELMHNMYHLPYATIRQYDCGRTPSPRFPRQQAQPACKPLLREVLLAVEHQAQQQERPLLGYSIELKSDPTGDNLFHPEPAAFVAHVLPVLQAAGVISRTTLLCFDNRVLQAARRQHPTLALCLLVEDNKPIEEHLHALGFVPEIYGPLHTLVDSELVRAARAHAMRLIPWTVNEPADMRALLALGVDGLTTDYPDRLLELLGRHTT